MGTARTIDRIVRSPTILLGVAATMILLGARDALLTTEEEWESVRLGHYAVALLGLVHAGLALELLLYGAKVGASGMNSAHRGATRVGGAVNRLVAQPVFQLALGIVVISVGLSEALLRLAHERAEAPGPWHAGLILLGMVTVANGAADLYDGIMILGTRAPARGRPWMVRLMTAFRRPSVTVVLGTVVILTCAWEAVRAVGSAQTAHLGLLAFGAWVTIQQVPRVFYGFILVDESEHDSANTLQ